MISFSSGGFVFVENVLLKGQFSEQQHCSVWKIFMLKINDESIFHSIFSEKLFIEVLLINFCWNSSFFLKRDVYDMILPLHVFSFSVLIQGPKKEFLVLLACVTSPCVFLGCWSLSWNLRIREKEKISNEWRGAPKTPSFYLLCINSLDNSFSNFCCTRFWQFFAFFFFDEILKRIPLILSC